MYIILGATGHIGSEIVKLLSSQAIGITHDESKKSQIAASGAKAQVVDINDVNLLTEVFNQGDTLYFLNPPGDITKNPSEQELESVASIVEAIEKSGIKKVVAESTYGAQPGENIGDLGVLYQMEKALGELNIDLTIIRGAYYFSNWDMQLESAKSESKIYTMYPVDFKLPMVAPKDIAAFAVEKLESESNQKLNFIEGPQHYSPSDVAHAFSKALDKEVLAVEIEKKDWTEYLKKGGFSQQAVESFYGMTQLTLEKPDFPENPNRGKTTLEDYISGLVKASE